MPPALRPLVGAVGRVIRRYWLEFAIERRKLAVFRVALFGVLGWDALEQIEHAPRYGAGGFNVGQLGWLDPLLPDPSRSGVLVLFCVQAYLAFCAALGAGTRACVWLLTALFGYTYFVSQLDSYQHHYLVFLVLVCCCFIPWDHARADRAEAAEAAADERRAKAAKRENAAKRDPGAAARVASWAVRLLIAQVAIVYLWAAVAKLSDPWWRDGTTLATHLSRDPGWMSGQVVSHAGLFAWSVLFTELFLAGALLVRGLWPAALVVGVGFHAGVELLGFEIGRFSYFMFAFYLLLVPDRWLAAALRPFAAATGRITTHAARVAAAWRARLAVAVAVLAVATGVGLVALSRLPFAEWTAVAITVTLLLVAGVVVAVRQSDSRARRRARLAGLGVAHLVACALIPIVVSLTDQAFDYYKYWGGASRRLGNRADAKAAYTAITERWPDRWGAAHYHLANVALADGDTERARAGYRRAQALVERHDYRPFLAEAELMDEAGEGDDARRLAEAALARMGARTPGRDRGRANRIVARWRRPGR